MPPWIAITAEGHWIISLKLAAVDTALTRYVSPIGHIGTVHSLNLVLAEFAMGLMDYARYLRYFINRNTLVPVRLYRVCRLYFVNWRDSLIAIYLYSVLGRSLIWRSRISSGLLLAW